MARSLARSLSNLVNILLKELTELNANTDMIIKNVQLAELNTTIAGDILNTQTLNVIQ